MSAEESATTRPRDAATGKILSANDATHTAEKNISAPTALSAAPTAPPDVLKTYDGSVTNMLKHIQNLEGKLSETENELKVIKQKNASMTAENRQNMLNEFDSVIKKFTTDLHNEEPGAVDKFNEGLKKLIEMGDNKNGIWRTVVCASKRHEQLAHNFDELKRENEELKLKVDGLYATPSSRISTISEDRLGKRKCEAELERTYEAADDNVWQQFASACSEF